MPTTLDAAPPAPSEGQLQRSIKLNIAAGFLGSFWLAVAGGMPLPLLMEAVNAGGFQLGLLSGVRQFSMLAQLPGAFIAEQLLWRKPFWATFAILHRAIWLVPALLPWLLPNHRHLWPLVIMAALGISDVFSNIQICSWFSWMADLIPPARAGRFWGIRQRFLSVALLVASLLFGLILDAFTGQGFLGFQIVFGLAAVFGVADVLVHLGVTEPPPQRHPQRAAPWQRILAPLRNRDFLKLTLALGVWNAAVIMPGYAGGLPSFFSIVYLKEAFGASYSQASWLFMASALGGVVFTPRIGHLIDQRGARSTMLALMAIGPLFSFAWLFVSPAVWQLPLLGSVPQPVLLLCAVSPIIGGAYAGVTLCQFRLTQVMTPATGRTVAMAVHWSLVGLIGTVGSLAAGWIKDHLLLHGSPMLAGLAPFSYFQLLILLQVALIWTVTMPIIRALPVSAGEK